MGCSDFEHCPVHSFPPTLDELIREWEAEGRRWAGTDQEPYYAGVVAAAKVIRSLGGVIDPDEYHRLRREHHEAYTQAMQTMEQEVA